ncbi:MAG: xylulose 5-phosphate 3-epimerase [Pseudomonadales bacterium]|nr:xylulose 5-phosphate 3-epimerase [Pseudomonadales bacterium]
MTTAETRFVKAQGLIEHQPLTRARVHRMAEGLVKRGLQPSTEAVYEILLAADRLMHAGCWLVINMIYARHVRLDGSPLQASDFKMDPQGHAGGSLNMVPAYVAYLALNALTHETRSWMMGQGHCVSAVDAINVLVDNMHAEHAARYAISDMGLTRLVKDFYRYRVRSDGRPESPLGSHVNAYTAGGMMEGGYLGFADLHYVHAALPGEKLVAFLSDGAFEEQRGADWAARWWRQEDSGQVLPVMIANGRRIDQRSGIMQAGGIDWFRRHLELNGFSPRTIDGRDPSSFVVAMYEAEEQLQAGLGTLPYLIAEAPKGYGFINAGTNLAHGTPLSHSPWVDAEARQQFNQAMARLWLPLHEIQSAVSMLNNHGLHGRVKERDHALAKRCPNDLVLPDPDSPSGQSMSPMAAVDGWMVEMLAVNPGRRVRLGNPDELRSNRMGGVLSVLKHRVIDPEVGNDEDRCGQVITALNEEAVVCACLANKAGINLVVSYEAFAVKMLGALRQEIIFARHLKEAGRPAQWHGLPVIVTSHTWENGKNEQSHQDPTLVEALAGEMSDMLRIIYPADALSAVMAIRSVYAERGRLGVLVIPKLELPVQMTLQQADELSREGACVLQDPPGAMVDLVACGAYQLHEMLRVSQRLQERGHAARLVYMQEPFRFRAARDALEAIYVSQRIQHYFSATAQARVFLIHGRPEAMLGHLRPLDLGPNRCAFMGYINQGGTLNVAGLLYANRCTYAHVLARLSGLLQQPAGFYLSQEELSAVEGLGDPYTLMAMPHGEF